MTTIKIYRNKRNSNKYIEVHNDGYYHNSIRQFMQWDNGIKNQTGDKCLHRLISSNLKELLEDYEEVQKVTVEPWVIQLTAIHQQYCSYNK